MKKLLLAAAVLLGPTFAFADDTAFFKVGPLELNIPFKTASIVYLYDGVGKRSLTGGETPIFTVWGRVSGTVGVVTTIDNAAGTPFLGADVDLGTVMDKFVTLGPIKIGGFGGRDFRGGAYIGGLKASTKLWG